MARPTESFLRLAGTQSVDGSKQPGARGTAGARNESSHRQAAIRHDGGPRAKAVQGSAVARRPRARTRGSREEGAEKRRKEEHHCACVTQSRDAPPAFQVQGRRANKFLPPPRTSNAADVNGSKEKRGRPLFAEEKAALMTALANGHQKDEKCRPPSTEACRRRRNSPPENNARRPPTEQEGGEKKMEIEKTAGLPLHNSGILTADHRSSTSGRGAADVVC